MADDFDLSELESIRERAEALATKYQGAQLHPSIVSAFGALADSADRLHAVLFRELHLRRESSAFAEPQAPMHSPLPAVEPFVVKHQGKRCPTCGERQMSRVVGQTPVLVCRNLHAFEVVEPEAVVE